MKFDRIAILARIAVLRAEVAMGLDPAIASLARSCGKSEEWIANAGRETAEMATMLESMLELIDMLTREAAIARGVIDSGNEVFRQARGGWARERTELQAARERDTREALSGERGATPRARPGACSCC